MVNEAEERRRKAHHEARLRLRPILNGQTNAYEGRKPVGNNHGTSRIEATLYIPLTNITPEDERNIEDILQKANVQHEMGDSSTFHAPAIMLPAVAGRFLAETPDPLVGIIESDEDRPTPFILPFAGEASANSHKRAIAEKRTGRPLRPVDLIYPEEMQNNDPRISAVSYAVRQALANADLKVEAKGVFTKTRDVTLTLPADLYEDATGVIMATVGSDCSGVKNVSDKKNPGTLTLRIPDIQWRTFTDLVRDIKQIEDNSKPLFEWKDELKARSMSRTGSAVEKYVGNTEQTLWRSPPR